ESELRTLIRNEFFTEAIDEEIDYCLNAMLLDIPSERLQLLEGLKNKFDLFLLSNTNSIHFRKFNEIASQSGIREIDSYFSKAYYSHLIRMRKPDPEIFEKVIQENGLHASKTLFIDDNLSNIEGARKLGINTVHLTNPNQLFELFR
ncbi:MAG TPA: HAD-IA family hydrolase, partial [Cyclobacteriaceae bacterium]|nr:HAD-IA family hydrolase [Cyclobacteriaceae bacterium]